MECSNCGSKNINFVGVQPRMPDPKGKSYIPKVQVPEYIRPNTTLSSGNIESNILIESKRHYKSEEFKMLIAPLQEDEENSDNDIEQSANDLAIDG